MPPPLTKLKLQTAFDHTGKKAHAVTLAVHLLLQLLAAGLQVTLLHLNATQNRE